MSFYSAILNQELNPFNFLMLRCPRAWSLDLFFVCESLLSVLSAESGRPRGVPSAALSKRACGPRSAGCSTRLAGGLQWRASSKMWAEGVWSAAPPKKNVSLQVWSHVPDAERLPRT